MASSAVAATYVGPNPGVWNEPSNWDGGFVPSVQFGETAVINNGATVSYPSTTLLDLRIENGGTLSLSGNSTWLQSESTHWTQVNDGTLTVDHATFRRANAGNLVTGRFTGSAGARPTSVINATNGALLDIGTTGGNFVLSYESFTTSTFNLINSKVVVAGEFWLGRELTTDNNQIADLNISNSSITTNGTVGLWVWDYSAEGTSFHINFTGPGGSYIEVADSIGMRASGSPGNNQATWESLWDLGILTAYGQSGATGASFNDYFFTDGTSTREGATAGATKIPYRLTFVPEPSAMILLASGAGILSLRRRRNSNCNHS